MGSGSVKKRGGVLGVYRGDFSSGKLNADSGLCASSTSRSSLSRQGCASFRSCLAQAVWIRWIAVSKGGGAGVHQRGKSKFTPTEGRHSGYSSVSDGACLRSLFSL